MPGARGWYTPGVDQALPDQLAILELVTGRLDAAGIPDMVTGAIAGGHYGPPRMTRLLEEAEA